MAKLNRPKPLLVSEAAARMPALVDRVTEHPGETVVIGNGGPGGAAVLVDSGHYQLLVEKARTADRSAGMPFNIVGSLQILVSDEELEEGIAARRRDQGSRAAAKLADL